MPPHIRCILSTRCILTHLHFYAFTCIHDALHSRSVAFKCICMHSNIRCILWTRCILTHSHSYAFKRMKMHSLTHAFRESADLPRGWLSSKTRMLTRVCILTHSYAFVRILAHSSVLRCIHSHITHTSSQGECRPPKGLAQLQDSCMLTLVCILTHSYAYGNAYECIIMRMHQNATHVNAPKCA